MKIYDTHAHLDQLKDLEASLKEAHEAGVAGIVAMSMNVRSCEEGLKIKNTYSQPKIYLGMGMHPSDASSTDLHLIVRLIREHHLELHAVGEIGLDFWYKDVRKDDMKKNEQRGVYRQLLALAKEFDLPAVIHSRGAWRECLQLATEAGVKKAEFHWYSGPLDVLEDILKAGYYVSTSPSVAYSPQSREAMKAAPIERTLIETDCPVFYKYDGNDDGYEARPKDVFRTLKACSELKQLDPQKALSILNKNAEEFFNLN